MNEYPEALRAFAARLPVPLYAVGGCVRDALLGKPCHDIDLASALRPEELQQFAAEAGYACPTVNARLGTVLLCIGGDRFEHTTFRTESYPQGGGHSPTAVAFTDAIEADAHRRDFSINAIYRDVQTGALVDPTGGVSDLDRRVLRTTTEDPSVILRDDGLRILRLARFAVSTGFAVDPASMRAAKAHVSLLGDVAWERRRQELDRMLEMDDVLRALHLLDELGAWRYLIPEIEDARGMAQRAEYHRHDVLEHLFCTCAEMPPEVPLRLMGLLHDIGKPESLRQRGDFHDHAIIGERMTETILRRLVYPNATVRRVKSAVRMHMFDLDDIAKTATVRLRFASLGRRGTEDLIALREADVRGSGIRTEYRAERWRQIYAEMQTDGCPWTMDELRVSGRDVCEALGISPSPAVSAVLHRLHAHCVKKPKDNERERLLRLARNVYVPKA